jgi:hypothetical protein
MGRDREWKRNELVGRGQKQTAVWTHKCTVGLKLLFTI